MSFVLNIFVLKINSNSSQIQVAIVHPKLIQIPFDFFIFFRLSSVVWCGICDLYTIRHRVIDRTIHFLYCPFDGSASWTNDRPVGVEKFRTKVTRTIDLVDRIGRVFGVHNICHRLQSTQHDCRPETGGEWRCDQRALIPSIWHMKMKAMVRTVTHTHANINASRCFIVEKGIETNGPTRMMALWNGRVSYRGPYWMGSFFISVY